MALCHLISACCWEIYFSNLVNYCDLWFSQPKPHIPMIFPLYSHVLVLLLLIISPYMPHNQNCFTLSLWKYRWIHWWIIVFLLRLQLKKDDHLPFSDPHIMMWFMDVYGVNPLKYLKYIPTAPNIWCFGGSGGKHILAALAKRKNHGVTVERCFTEDFSGR